MRIIKDLIMKQLFNIFLSVSLLSISFPILADIETQTISTRIVGGDQSDFDEWPSIVSLKFKYNDFHFCGGTLIAEQWVLTAAHCMFDLPLSASEISATVGEYDLSSSPITPATDIEQIFTHPDYNPTTQINDIALLKLSTSVDNATVAMVDLPLTVDLIALEYPTTALGWGSTVGYTSGEIVVPIYPNILNEVEVPLNTDQQCSENLNGINTNYTEEMICAGLPEGGKDACQGDSGGPLMVDSNDGWQQIGIVSWGFGCAAENSPGVYTRLALYADWINYLIKTYTTFSITVITEFSQISVNNSGTKQITIENYSDNEANFTYEFAGSEYFSVNASACETVTAHSSCQFPVTYAPLDVKTHTATITVNSDIPNAIPQKSELYGKPLTESSSSGSLGLFTFLLLPLLFIRRSYP